MLLTTADVQTLINAVAHGNSTMSQEAIRVARAFVWEMESSRIRVMGQWTSIEEMMFDDRDVYAMLFLLLLGPEKSLLFAPSIAITGDDPDMTMLRYALIRSSEEIARATLHLPELMATPYPLSLGLVISQDDDGELEPTFLYTDSIDFATAIKTMTFAIQSAPIDFVPIDSLLSDAKISAPVPPRKR